MIAVDGRDGIEDVRREREVAREKVQGTDKCLGVVPLILLLLLLLHGAKGPFFFFLLTNIWNSQLLCDSHSPHRQKRTLSRLVLCLLRETKTPLFAFFRYERIWGRINPFFLQLQTRLYIFSQRPFYPLLSLNKRPPATIFYFKTIQNLQYWGLL